MSKSFRSKNQKRDTTRINRATYKGDKSVD